MKTHIEIHAENLRHNLRLFKKNTARKTMFVVKANAYGHGLQEVIAITKDCPDIDWFAIDSLHDARILHAAAVKKPVLVLGWADRDELQELIQLGYELVVPTLDHLKMVRETATKLKKPARIQFKVETGTGRMGLEPEIILNLWKKAASPYVTVSGLYSHFANIEDTSDHSFASAQLDRFTKLLKQLSPKPQLRHFSCSASTLLFPKTYFDIVRLGISAYGFWPSRQTYVSYLEKKKEPLQLKPVLGWYAKVAQVKHMKKGSTIGYGLTYRTFSNARIIVVPVGYYDGYDRQLSNMANIMLRGTTAPLRGRICMNMCMAEVSHIPHVKVGDRITLAGQDGNEKITIDQLAELAGTINYEFVSRINPLIPRVIV